MVNISTCAFPCEQENNLGSLTVETREKECLVMEIVTWYPYCDARVDYNPLPRDECSQRVTGEQRIHRHKHRLTSGS